MKSGSSEYTGKILHVDLTSGIIEKISIDGNLMKDYIGGRGLGARLLWENTPAKMNPLDPEAPLYFLTGPLTGLVPGGAHTCIVFKSPETEITLGHPTTGANWGSEIRFAGYEGVVVAGVSEKPVYLYINNDDVQIRDASHLWGKGTIRTEVELKRKLKYPHFRILSIGPAGENLVRFASVQQEYFRSAARGGAGCLMGSKKLKAIAVKGTGSLPVRNLNDFRETYWLIDSILKDSRRKIRRGYYLNRWGSTISQIPHSDVSELDVKNYREAYWKEIDKIGGLEFERRYFVKSRSCFLCPLNCMQVGVIRDEPYRGVVCNPDFDNHGAIGSGCLIDDLASVNYLIQVADDFGLDGISIGNVTGFAMECYERGILTKKDLDGIELTWGNVPAIIQLWKKIISREGIGELLSLGVKKASEVIGHESERFAMHVKGLELAGYNLKAHPDRGLQSAVGDRGGCHHYGLDIAEQDHRAWSDSLTVCSWHRPFIEPRLYLRILNSVTGWELNEDDWKKTAERILILARAYNIREGMVPLKDDILPWRIHNEPLTEGPRKGALYPLNNFEQDRVGWYNTRGCDEKGIPTPSKLKGLGLDFVIQEL